MRTGVDIFSLTLLCIYTPIYILGTIWFIKRRHIEPILSRSWQLVCVSIFFGYLNFLNSTLSNFLAPRMFVACMLSIWSSTLFIPLWALPYFIRAYILYFNYSWRMQFIGQHAEKMQNSWWFHFQRKYATLIGLSLYIAVGIIVLIATGAIMGVKGYDPTISYLSGVCLTSNYIIIIYIEGGVVALLIIISIIGLFRVRDPFFIKKELIIFLAGGVPTLIIWSVTKSQSFHDMDFPSEIFVLLVYCYSFFVSVGLPLFVSYRKKTAPSVDSSSSRRMSSISLTTGDLFQLTLDSPVLLQSLQQHMVEHWNVENLLFLLELRKYDLLYLEDEAQTTEAKRIWHLYLGPGSVFEINIDSSTKKRIGTLLNAGKIDSTLFEEAKKVVTIQIKEDSFLKWKATASFHEALAQFEALNPDSI